MNKLLPFLLFSIILFDGCKKDDESFSTPVEFSGIWVGSWESKSHLGVSGTFIVNVIQQENILSGTINVPEIDMENAKLKGTVNGEKISFGDISGLITFSGHLDTDSVGSGSYNYSTLRDKGNWQALKPGINSSYLWLTDTIDLAIKDYVKIVTSGNNFLYAINTSSSLLKISLEGIIVDSIPCPAQYPNGLAIDGSNILIGDEMWGTGVIFKLNGLEKIVYSLPGIERVRGICANNEYIWIIDDVSNKIYKRSIQNGNFVDTIPMDNNYSCISFDGVNFWTCSYYANLIYKINQSGQVLSEYIIDWGIPKGLVYANGFLWIIDGDEKKIYKTDTNLNLISTIVCPTEFPVSITSDGTNLWVMSSDYSFNYTQALKISTSGTLLATIDLPWNNHNVGGIAFSNNNLWYTDPTYNILYKLNPSGSSCIKYTVQFDYFIWDGTNIICYSDEEKKLYKLSPAGILIQTYSVNVNSPTGMTWDGKNIWIMIDDFMNSTIKLKKFDTNGKLLKTIDACRPTAEGGQHVTCYGITYHDSAFWIFGKDYFSPTMKIFKYSF